MRSPSEEIDFSSRFPKTFALLNSARNDTFPSYGVGIFFRGQHFFSYAGCGPDSLFDLASLTKVICTTTVTALAEQKGFISTGNSVQEFFREFPASKVKISHLLDHSSGLPDWLPLHNLFHNPNSLGSFDPFLTPPVARQRYEKEIITSWKSEDFEKSAIYSDLGFMLLGWALEKATGMPLDAIFQEWVVHPLSLKSLQFLPTSPDVVPTEDCPWRGRILRGEVHDDNCYVLGGVAGHAGLFGNTRHVLEMGKLWLDSFSNLELASETNKEIILLPKTARKYWTASSVPGSSRALGWDGTSKQGSSTGHYFSPESRGHLGYTGTSLWIDPNKNLVVALLTNRVHPSRENSKIKSFRPLFHDSVILELGAVT